MREAEITCLAPKVTIVDLSLRLIRGEILWVPAESAEKSKDLWKLRDMGSLSVRWVQRYRVLKQQGSSERMEYIPPVKKAEVKEPEPQIDVEDLSRRMHNSRG